MNEPAPISPTIPGTITISLRIENTYQSAPGSLERETVVTTVTDVVIPAPPKNGIAYLATDVACCVDSTHRDVVVLDELRNSVDWALVDVDSDGSDADVAIAAADVALEAGGWERVGDWRASGNGNGYDAPVRRTDEYDEWVREQIHDRTGTGRTSGHAWYDVEVTACSDPALVGQTFEFGY